MLSTWYQYLGAPLIVQYRAMAYSNNSSSQDDFNGVDEVLQHWGVYKDPRTFTNVVCTGIDTEEEKRNTLLGTILATFENQRQNWEAFFPNQPMELVIPVIPSREHRLHMFSVSISTQFIDNEIVGNEDCQVCVVDLVSISTESTDSDLLDIKQSSCSKAKAKGSTLKEIPDIVVTNLEIIHGSYFPKNSKIVGVADRKVIEQVEASNFFLVRIWIN